MLEIRLHGQRFFLVLAFAQCFLHIFALRSRSKATLLSGPWRHLIAPTGAFGPDGCVRITRTQVGTCSINTNCKRHRQHEKGSRERIEYLEFSFFCLKGRKLTKHSYGYGGFKHSEHFDTDVECDSCHAPRLSDYEIGAHHFHKVAMHSAHGAQVLQRSRVPSGSPSPKASPSPQPVLVGAPLPPMPAKATPILQMPEAILPAFCPVNATTGAFISGVSPCCEEIAKIPKIVDSCVQEMQGGGDGTDPSNSSAPAKLFCDAPKCRSNLENHLSLIVATGTEKIDPTGLCGLIAQAIGATRQLMGALCAPSAIGATCIEELAVSMEKMQRYRLEIDGSTPEAAPHVAKFHPLVDHVHKPNTSPLKNAISGLRAAVGNVESGLPGDVEALDRQAHDPTDINHDAEVQHGKTYAVFHHKRRRRSFLELGSSIFQHLTGRYSLLHKLLHPHELVGLVATQQSMSMLDDDVDSEQAAQLTAELMPAICTECATSVMNAALALIGSALLAVEMAPELQVSIFGEESENLPVKTALLAAKDFAGSMCSKSQSGDFCAVELIKGEGVPSLLSIGEEGGLVPFLGGVLAGDSLCAGACGKPNAQTGIAAAALYQATLGGKPAAKAAAGLIQIAIADSPSPSSEQLRAAHAVVDPSKLVELGSLSERSCGTVRGGSHCSDEVSRMLGLTGAGVDSEMKRGSANCVEAHAGGTCTEACAEFLTKLDSDHGCCDRVMLLAAFWAFEEGLGLEQAGDEGDAGQLTFSASEKLTDDVHVICLDRIPETSLRDCKMDSCPEDSSINVFVEMPGEVWSEAVTSEAHEDAFRLALRSDVATSIGEPKEAILISGKLRSPEVDSSIEMVLDVVTETCNRNSMVRQLLMAKALDDLVILGETTRLLATLQPSLAGRDEMCINAELYLSNASICIEEKCKDVLFGHQQSRKTFKERFRHVVSASLTTRAMKVQESDIVVTSLRIMQKGPIYVQFHALLGHNKSALESLRNALIVAMEDPKSELQRSMRVVANRSSVSVSSALRDLRPPRLVVDQTYSGVANRSSVIVAGGIASFGPDNCVSVYLGRRGTCVIRTVECDANKISKYKVLFQCNPPGSKKGKTHAFNEGAFATDETYETGVYCEVCDGPPEMKSNSFYSCLTVTWIAMAIRLFLD